MLFKLQNENERPSQVNKFIATNLAFEDREILRGLKFKFDETLRSWWTDDWLKVAQAEAIYSPVKAQKIKEALALVASETCFDPAFDAFCEYDINFSKLLPYQRAGVSYILKEKNVILADEPGLGKTMQAIATMNYAAMHDKEFFETEKTPRAVVVCPSSIKDNWLKELDFFQENFWEVVIVNSGKQQFVDKLLTSKKRTLIIVNYEYLKNRIVSDQLKRFSPNFLVLDEAHYIKNPKSKRYKCIAHELIPNWKELQMKILLTGTPIQNRPIEIRSLMLISKPDVLEPYREFRRFAFKYCDGRMGKWGFEASGSSNEEELGLRLALGGAIIRRKKENVLPQLPDKTMTMLVFEGNTDAKRVIKKYDVQFDFEAIIKKPEFWQKNPNEHIATARRELAIAKLPDSIEAIKELLESVDKVVVFAWHTDIIDALEKALSEYKPALIAGRTKSETRQAEVDRFQNDPACRVFIGNILAAGVGITLTAASHIEFVESSWVPGEIFQAVDRCHRIGQKSSVSARFHVVKNSVDEAVIGSLISKNLTIKKILS
ncbi:DEXDc domain containing protein [uncultured Caudovirales phage]|uniref:DEXDc domain containing protein n=1 Tax=uncultured Caudovirales phage TaxID=2100421 RepID=A0A6J5MVT7_9CAUD|nr:DEXDc domain containing protein [uncultured Caudovirales phage]